MTVPPGALVLRAVGGSALLAEVPDARSALALYSRLRAQPSAPPALDGVIDVVPAERTVLVTFDPALTDAARVRRWLQEAAAAPETPGAGRAQQRVEIPVTYDGSDLDDVARALGLTVGELIALHTTTRWTAAFIGFAPGFAYLTGDDDGRLTLPRRATPRPAVPPGSVALAAGYCGVYPRESPGGWHLIGRTDALLWDARRDDPALIAPGTDVRFVDAG
ncbi:allophanate hydrolase subunit 1 [Herbiconiux sp. VKM Ac-2851]|uniref:5-oxoprolinase subunit B family protein n=1 Tax=Herbiconiux sp. VKM Ac-2851 TaxID=2739025 RepID=UPI0015642041|nr:allophanate hydrolase subunit 1 [Herbiconiux sp. VKM Ac-2851]NQX33749.1 allophanate hydrolase subunit 1 [Herbiconiux sp. VKM Ac-2851]